jgi:hypothetical protein
VAIAFPRLAELAPRYKSSHFLRHHRKCAGRGKLISCLEAWPLGRLNSASDLSDRFARDQNSFAPAGLCHAEVKSMLAARNILPIDDRGFSVNNSRRCNIRGACAAFDIRKS